MAQAGYTPIQLYYSTTASAAPSSGNLANGELAINITDGKLYYKDNGGVVRVLATAAGSAGDVVGPGSSTDNALVRFDGTTGKLVQNSAGVLDDSGNLTGLASVTATTLTGALTGSVGATTPNTGAFTTLSASGAVTLSGGTANGVPYLNGSKVLTTGSALTYDGTALTVGTNGLYLSGNTGGAAYVSTYAASAITEMIFGTSSNVPIRFIQNNAEQMRLTSTGLGIGTSSPSNRLSVTGPTGTIASFTNGVTADLSIICGASATSLNAGGSNVLAFQTGGTEKARIDSSGNLGLGVTPSAGVKLQLANTEIVGFAGTDGNFATNAYYSGGWKYVTTGASGKYSVYGGSHNWFTAPSGTAGNAISFTQAMTLNASGQLALGTTTVTNALLNIGNPSSGSVPFLSVIATSNNTEIAYMQFNQSDDMLSIWNKQGFSGSGIRFGTNNAERARIDSSGNLLVGTTSAQARCTVWDTSGSTTTARFFKNAASTAALPALVLDKFDNNSTTSQIFAQFTINNQSAGCGQINANGASQAAFGSYSDRRLKENIVDLPPQLANIMALRPVEFDYIESEGGGHQISFIAQEMETVYSDAVGERADGMKTITGWGKTEARLVKAIQEQQAIIEQLKADVAALKGA